MSLKGKGDLFTDSVYITTVEVLSYILLARLSLPLFIVED